MRLNEVDGAGHYAAEIRKYLEAAGPLTAQLTVENPLGRPSLRPRGWGLPTLRI